MINMKLNKSFREILFQSQILLFNFDFSFDYKYGTVHMDLYKNLPHQERSEHV